MAKLLREYKDYDPTDKCYLDKTLELIRVIIVVEHEGEGEHIYKSRHSNLLIIDSNEKTVRRFEPLSSHMFHGAINDALKAYFRGKLPDYDYSELPVHPQPNVTKGECEGKGMCVAYVIKAALEIVRTPRPGHHILDFPSDHEDADEDIYGPLGGKPDIEYGPDAGGLIGGALLGGYAGTLGYGGPYPYNPYCRPPYYYYGGGPYIVSIMAVVGVAVIIIIIMTVSAEEAEDLTDIIKLMITSSNSMMQLNFGIIKLKLKNDVTFDEV